MTGGLVHLYHMTSSDGFPRKTRSKTIIWNGIELTIRSQLLPRAFKIPRRMVLVRWKETGSVGDLVNN